KTLVEPEDGPAKIGVAAEAQVAEVEVSVTEHREHLARVLYVVAERTAFERAELEIADRVETQHAGDAQPADGPEQHRGSPGPAPEFTAEMPGRNAAQDEQGKEADRRACVDRE